MGAIIGGFASPLSAGAGVARGLVSPEQCEQGLANCRALPGSWLPPSWRAHASWAARAHIRPLALFFSALAQPSKKCESVVPHRQPGALVPGSPVPNPCLWSWVRGVRVRGSV